MMQNHNGHFIPQFSGGEIFEVDISNSDAAKPAAPQPVLTAVEKSPPHTQQKPELGNLSARKQRQRAFNPFHGLSGNKALEEAERYYHDGNVSTVTGYVAGGIIAASLLIGGILWGVPYAASLISLLVFEYFYLSARNHYRNCDICLLQAPDHIRGNYAAAQKSRSRLLQLPHYAKLYGENGAGLKNILDKNPLLRIKTYQNATTDADAYGAAGGARDHLREEAKKREIPKGEAKLAENANGTAQRRAARDAHRRGGNTGR